MTHREDEERDDHAGVADCGENVPAALLRDDVRRFEEDDGENDRVDDADESDAHHDPDRNEDNLSSTADREQK